MFEPVKQSETRLGCRWRGCQFGLEFDSPELREIIREESICSHSHRDEPGRGVVSELQIQYGLEKKRPRPTSKPAVNIASFLSFSLKVKISFLTGAPQPQTEATSFLVVFLKAKSF